MKDKISMIITLPSGADDPTWSKAYNSIVGDEETKKAALWDFIQIVKAIGVPAKLTERDAKIARLQEALAEIELGIDALSDEDDDGRRIPTREMKRQALEVIRSEIKALKGGAP